MNSTLDQKIRDCIAEADRIIEMIDAYDAVLSYPSHLSFSVSGLSTDLYYQSRQKVEDTVDGWFLETQAILDAIRGETDDLAQGFRTRAHMIIPEQGYKAGIVRKISSGRFYLNSVLKAEKNREDIKALSTNAKKEGRPSNKLRKVFISHKYEDENYAEALINLINFIIGPDGDRIFCSSVQGYGIKQSRSILDELKRQFDAFEIFMIIIHSPRFYESPICLNEMGASWVLGTRFSSFMTGDCDYSFLKGVIDNNVVCININDSPDQINAHLNDFKDELLDFFSLGRISENKWENARNRFIHEVSSITY